MRSRLIVHVFPRSTARSGVTLLEVVVSAGAGAILFSGLAAAVMLSLRAGDSTAGPYQRSQLGADALLLLTRELQHATAFNSSYSTANRIEFTIPDQTGDGAAETVRYSWSGTAGHPLYRSFNGGAAVEIVSNVHTFQLRYRNRALPPAPKLTEGSETQYLDQSGLALLSLWQDVAGDTQIGEYFAPSISSSAVSWRVTRIQLSLDSTSSTKGILIVQVRTADDSKKPTDVVLGQSILAESTMSGGWYTVTFENAGKLLPSEGACIVLQSGNGSSEAAAATRINFLSTSSPSTLLLSSSNGGSSWSTSTSSDLWLRVWGRTTTQSAGSGSTRYFRTGIDASIQVGPSTASTVTASVQTVNQPEVAGP